MFVCFVICLVGFFISIIFCTNWGFILFDCIDHYMSNYLLILIGILECFGIAWCFDGSNTMRKSKNHSNSNWALCLLFWIPLLITALVTVPLNMTMIGMPIFSTYFFFIACPISFYLYHGCFRNWYNEIFFCGTNKISYTISKLNRIPFNYKKVLWWESIFAFYLGFCIKYICPVSLTFLIFDSIKIDIERPY